LAFEIDVYIVTGWCYVALWQSCSVIFVRASGGAGEGKQHLTPSGTLKNIHQVKSDESLPFYCHPPNPCPKGFTGWPIKIPIVAGCSTGLA